MNARYVKALETQAAWQQSSMPLDPRDPNFFAVGGAWADILANGETVYVDSHFCALIDHARRTVPDDLAWENSWLPCERGFMYLETPFSMPPVDLSQVPYKILKAQYPQLRIRAIGWRPSTELPGATLFMFACDGLPGTMCQNGFVPWCFVTLSEGEEVLERLRNFETLLRTPDSPGYVPGKEMDEQHEIRWLYTALHLMSEKLAVTRKEQTSPLARSMARRKGRPINHDLRIVMLRRMEQDRQREQGAHSDREYHWQWVVTGHWRRQPYRAGVYKNIFIEAFIKGPQNMPLKPLTHRLFVVQQ